MNATKVRRIDFSADEWLAGTLELKPYDRGIYITVCALIYSRGDAVGIELLARHCGVHRNALNASLRRLVACGKIDVNGAEITQGRCIRELKIAKSRLNVWSENLGQSNENNEIEPPRGESRAGKNKGKESSKESVDISLNLESVTAPARARANGHHYGQDIDVGPLGSLRSPAPSAPLKEVKRAQLVQKLMRFAHATMNEGQRQAAIAGLTGLDAEHTAQWWLDNLDQRMRAKRWDDSRE